MIEILHYSDVENATDDPGRVARLAGCIRANRSADTLLCGTGDVVAPGVLSDETAGEAILPFLEAVDPDFSTFGNHDFDHGPDALRRVVARSPQQWLVANLREEGKPFASALGVRPAAATTVGGERVGLVGVTDPDTLDGHVHATRLTVTDPVEAVEDAVDELATREVDATVVLSHAGRRDDEIAALDGVDLVLGGHDHDRRAGFVDGTPVVRPGARGDWLAEVHLDGDSTDLTLHDVSEATAVEGVRETYLELYSETGLDATVARVGSPVQRRRRDRYPESAVGNVVADAVRRAADADVAVVHPGMFRSGPPLVGDVSIGEIRACTPFDNELYSTRLGGDELLALFESFAFPEPLSHLDVGPEVYGHVSGARLAWRRDDDTLTLVDATVGGEVEAATTYTVAAPAFEFHSDLYPVLDEGRVADTHGHQHDALVEYARQHGLEPETDGRMRAVEDAATDDLRSLR